MSDGNGDRDRDPSGLSGCELERWRSNPILEPRGDDWEALAVFNPAAILRGDGKICLIYRAIGDYTSYVSRLGYAIFDEEIKLIFRSDEPFFGPDPYLGEASVEDPRAVQLDSKAYLTYVVTQTPTPPGPVRLRLGQPKPKRSITRIGLAEFDPTFACHEPARLGIITPYRAEERDTVLFPERIHGSFALLHRPSNWLADPSETRPGIWFAYLDRLQEGRTFHHRLVMTPQEPWEALKIGAGPPPIKTEHGWLLIYHGVDEERVYRAGAALLDLEEPWKVVARTKEPILEPEEPYEVEGDVPNVVFPTGAFILDGTLYVFYGAADKVCCLATAKLERFLEGLLSQPAKAQPIAKEFPEITPVANPKPELELAGIDLEPFGPAFARS